MNCIIVDDEPLAREAIVSLIFETSDLQCIGSFNNATSASRFLKKNDVDLVFLDIQMPGVTGLEFAKEIPRTTLVIFTTAYTEYALESYETDAIDYLLKPVDTVRFKKAVAKAHAYHALLLKEEDPAYLEPEPDYFFVKSERRYFRILYADILFVEGLKDYVIIQLADQRIITHMNLKNMNELLPKSQFIRVSKSFIINKMHVASFDNNDVFIKNYEIAIGNNYRDAFFDTVVRKGPIKA